jgi:hypothetical protein
MPKTSRESFVAICLGPSLGNLGNFCSHVELGSNQKVATEKLHNHIAWCHFGDDIAFEVAPLEVATLMLNPPRYHDDELFLSSNRQGL